jgi:hypothetical protein
MNLDGFTVNTDPFSGAEADGIFPPGNGLLGAGAPWNMAMAWANVAASISAWDGAIFGG